MQPHAAFLQLQTIRNSHTVQSLHTVGPFAPMGNPNTNRLDDLFCKQHRPLLRIVTRVVGNPAVAEDLVQETYLRVRRALGEQRIDYLQPFLFQTAQNLARDHLRSERRWGSLVDRDKTEDAIDQVPSSMPRQDAVARDRERLGHLEKTLMQLTPRQRRVFLDARLKGRSHDAIAADLGVSKSTVQKDLKAAMAACMAAFDRF